MKQTSKPPKPRNSVELRKGIKERRRIESPMLFWCETKGQWIKENESINLEFD